jgi:hypothetical protein
MTKHKNLVISDETVESIREPKLLMNFRTHPKTKKLSKIIQVHVQDLTKEETFHNRTSKTYIAFRKE